MGILVFILLIGLFILLWYLIPSKGEMAEIRVHNVLIELPEDYYVIDNVIIGNNNYSSQIDHVVVSPYGIFVIETKGYKGWIYGGENAQYWTQNIYGYKYQLYNPILQNQGHVKALMKILPSIPNDFFIPIVCFNNDASIFVKVQNHIVINRRKLKNTIKRYNTPIISSENKEKIIRAITSHMKVGKEVEKTHVYNARNKAVSSYKDIREGVCPRCGGQIVLRHGKYGAFYGCSNYPKCKFTMQA